MVKLFSHTDLDGIGCGLDRLNWNDVSEQIKSIFADTDVEILVCKR